MSNDLIPAYSTLDSIVLQVWSDQGPQADEATRRRYFQWAIRGFKQLQLFSLPMDQAIDLPVQTGVRCVVLPSDFIKFTAIGITRGNLFHAFTLKPDLQPTLNYVCGMPQQVTPVIQPNIHRAAGYGNFEYAEGGGKNYWYYKEDYPNNRILIDGAPLTMATLIYTSTGIKMNSETLIPKIAEEAMIAFIHWQEELNSKPADKGMIMIRRQEFEKAVDDIRHAELNIEALMDAVRSTIYQGVKR